MFFDVDIEETPMLTIKSIFSIIENLREVEVIIQPIFIWVMNNLSKQLSKLS
ncbi:hypothetical protein ETSB_0053 [cyanobacterium endosymbiont of Epithemia turgida isolate EtSB Lake Yunoko]|nr:hypothetical protein ETSB_0053 [cyanobacterium endosymbiont of Epithemia turgida isolate EtSB Lake Yunoko]